MTASEFKIIFFYYFYNLCRFAIYWPIPFKLNYVVRATGLRKPCEFHKDRLNDRVSMFYFVYIQSHHVYVMQHGQKQKRQYISGLAVTAGQSLVLFCFS